MTRRKKENSPLVDRYWTKARKLNAPIILEYFMVKELPSSLEGDDMRELSVCTDPTNENSTRVKRKIRILDHL